MNSVKVKHSELNVQELEESILNESFPVKRSTHVGNQPAHELVIQCLLPPGILNIAVDTVQAGDNYTNPRAIRLDRLDIPIAVRKLGSKIVSSVVVRENIEEILADMPPLVIAPRPGESLVSFHMRALEHLRPTNMPVLMSELFTGDADLYRAMMRVAMREGQVDRIATASGSIETTSEDPDIVGIYGFNDASAVSQGILPSLNVMMALDMLASIKEGATKTMHLAGPDMVRYVDDAKRMENVELLMGKTAAEIGLVMSGHCYDVVDITGLSRTVPAAHFTSQHQLLRVQDCSNSLRGEVLCAGISQ